MKRQVIFSPRATETLERIYVEVAGHTSPETSLRFVEDIEDRCELLARFPMLGMSRGDLMAGLRVLTLDRRITIAYRVIPTHILIAMIFWRGQDFEAALRSDPKVDG